MCAQIGAARHEESGQQLETLLALPVSRRGCLCGRLLLATCGAASISVVAGLFTWIGAASQGVNISLAHMLEAGANCLPVALLFLGIAALAYALAPRASGGIAYHWSPHPYGTSPASFSTHQKWLVDLTPFAHVGMVPVQSFRAGAAIAMLAIGAASALAALAALQRRDQLGA